MDKELKNSIVSHFKEIEGRLLTSALELKEVSSDYIKFPFTTPNFVINYARYNTITGAFDRIEAPVEEGKTEIIELL